MVLVKISPVLLVLVVIALVVSSLPALSTLPKTVVVSNVAVQEEVVWYEAHSVERHGLEVVQMIRDCLDKNGPVKQMFNSQTARHADICQLPNGKFGVQVCTNDWTCEWTAFVKDKLKTLDQVVHYLENVGYH